MNATSPVKSPLPALVNLMMDLSGQQSDSLGNTNDQMSERGLSWIIVQYDMQIERMPHQGEEIILETEAMSYNRFSPIAVSGLMMKGNNCVWK